MECIANAMYQGLLNQLQLVGMFMGIESTNLLIMEKQWNHDNTISNHDAVSTISRRLRSLQICRINFDDTTLHVAIVFVD